MSSTNRSDARKKHVADYYVTPVGDIITFLNEFKKVEPDAFKNGEILDCCAGGDENNPMSYPEALTKTGVDNRDIFTQDIREDSRAEIIDDFLNSSGKFNVIITNPPFNLALEIIEKALDDVKEGGFVIMLLRLNFLGSVKRRDFWRNNPPKYVFVHHQRMSFTSDRKTDSIEYAHFVWQKGQSPTFSNLRVI